MAAVGALASGTTRSRLSGDDQVLRFRRSERLVHWALAIPFMVCYTTALILVVVYNPDPTRPFRLIVSWTHRISGMCLFVLPLWTIVRNLHEVDLHLGNIKEVWHWTQDDLKWLFLIGPATMSRKIALPHQGKFNAGEKLNFMSVSATYSLYILTGLGIWFGGVRYACWLVHFSMAAAATPLIVGHILMATVNPDTRPGLTGMISGLVDREWAKHHYHRWYQQHHGHVASAPRPAVRPVSPRLVPPAGPVEPRLQPAAPAANPGSGPAGAPLAVRPLARTDAAVAPVANPEPPARSGRNVAPTHGRSRVLDVSEAEAAFAVADGGVDAAIAS